ncbi:dicarboxylate/amino acid:cation symporter [Streptococcus halotolerans]|uniref:dicarboxylate/amino acid:cation symporter n=1 Tax=Streptococcus halotolerans TaxID=1814128 RepID=UPI0007895398|nr:dicarboxylate/amino acid:cation symporter [Streptococcus halotolerans]
MVTIKSITSRLSLGVQLLIASVLGALVGCLQPSWADGYQFLGQAFLNLINMVIIPLVVPLVVVAVAGVIGKESFGKLLTRSLVYFFLVTTLITTIFVFAAYNLGFGNDTNIGQAGSSLEGLTSSIEWDTFFLGFIPSNIIKVLSEGALLPSIVFAIFLGYGIGKLETEKSQFLIDALNTWIEAIYHIVGAVIKLSPIGIFGFIAHDVATTGLEKLFGLGQFVFGTYAAYAVLFLIIFPFIALVFRVSYTSMIKEIWELLTLAFISGSSSIVLPPLLQKLKDRGHNEAVTDFVVPLGYSFNLEGAAAYSAMATVFIANAYGIEWSFGQLVFTVLVLTLIGKTVATVPSGAIVVLLAAAPQLGLPEEGVGLIFAVDFFVNAGRTALNVVGQALAVSVIEKNERAIVAVPEIESNYVLPS